MILRWLTQIILLILIIERLLVTIVDLDRWTRVEADRWADDYQQIFCGRYLAWEQNWLASFQWLAEYEWQDMDSQEVVLIAQDEKSRLEAYWDQAYLARCLELQAHYELYYQQNPSIQHPYPNWAVRYLAVRGEGFVPM